MSVPVIRCRATDADEAYEAHAALLRAERDAPGLRDLASFASAKQDAYERFAKAFARL